MWRQPIIWLFALIAVVLGVAIWQTVGHSSSESIKKTSPSVQATKSASEVVIFPFDPVKGQLGASLTIIEFGDFECVYCAQTASTIGKVIAENPGKIKLVWKDFPLPSHIQAQAAAEAAQCAAQQGKFWQYHDSLFLNQANLGEATYLSAAGEVGLNFEKFSQCLRNHETLPLVQQNTKEAYSIGVDSTPFFIINGQAFSGIITEEFIESYIK